jgi:type IV pilus assembly protein PilB
MAVKNQKKFEQVLVECKVLSSDELDLAKIESVKIGKNLDEVLVESGKVSQEDVVKAKAIASGNSYIELTKQKIEEKVIKLLEKDYCERYQVVPFGITNNRLNLAMVDPTNVQVIDFIEKKTNLKVAPFIASPSSIKSGISQFSTYSPEDSGPLGNVFDEEEKGPNDQKDPDGKEKNNISQDAPVTRAVNTILSYAIKSKASDIHIEPREKTVKVRYRIDGILNDSMTLPKHVHAALVSRIKILSNLKIDEHRLPQDGRFGIKIAEKDVDLRVSISPIVFGEKVVIRILDKSGGVITLDKLGFKGKAYRIIDEASKKPHGMILSTGPTGSGKSTTLYAVLSKINSPEVNIITLEDPVEYNIEGINQIQIHSAIGLTFAAGLRSVLRQDPDVVMVGEIRDGETADLAVQAALTGHVVLSTLHTNSAAGVLPRLKDMKVEPFLIASTVNTVVGQRLVRTICKNCKESYTASETEYSSLSEGLKNVLPKKDDPKAKEIFEDLGHESLPFLDDTTYTLYKGKGCESCNKSGYSGRMGIYELFAVTPQMERLLVSDATSAEIQDAAVEEGMITMKQDGYLKALAGITTISEIARVAQDY